MAFKETANREYYYINRANSPVQMVKYFNAYSGYVILGRVKASVPKKLIGKKVRIQLIPEE